MMLEELLRRNRSYRGFFQQPQMTKKQITALVELTRLCPSSGNLQPLKYRIICEARICEQILPLTRWGGRMKSSRLPRPGMEPTAYILVLHDLSISPNPAAYARDVGIAAHTMLLGAAEMGFGGCMLGGYSPARLAEALALPEHLLPALLIALGKPAENIVLEDAPFGTIDRDNSMYRDEQDVHHVRKRMLEEIIV